MVLVAGDLDNHLDGLNSADLFKVRTKIAALDSLAEHLGMFIDQVVGAGKVPIQANVIRYSDRESKADATRQHVAGSNR
jgi:hypothetical protein